MKLIKARLLNYKSVIDTELQVQRDITCLVGAVGAGKTSVLELLSKIDISQGFDADNLPVKGDVADQFRKDAVSADEIKHLIATFDVEEIDRTSLPDGFGNLARITFTRFFDGGWDMELEWAGEPGYSEGLDIEPEIARVEQALAELDLRMDAAQNSTGITPQDKATYDAERKCLVECIRDNPDEIGDRVANLKNALLFVRQDGQLRAHSNKTVAELESAVRDVESKLQDSRKSIVYESLPKPEYIPSLPGLAYSVQLDEYLNYPQKSSTFEAIGLICGFSKTQLNNIRNSEPHTKSNYFDEASENLTSRFSKFWSQAQHELIVGLDEDELVFSIRDKKSDLITKITQCSEGLKWVLALFFKINTLISSSGSSHILLFDSPATAVHDAGKEEILRFLTKVSEENHVQIVYATHEKSLIDPRHLERIRFVSKEHKSGTKISETKGGGIDTTEVEIGKHVGRSRVADESITRKI